MKQISWGQRVRGIVTEDQLTEWYDRCLRGKFSQDLGSLLVDLLIESFEAEFPEASNQANIIEEFCRERGYNNITVPQLWQVNNGSSDASKKSED